MKTAAVASFFAPDAMDDAERRSLLPTCGCAYVFVSPYERALGDWDPDSVEFLSPVFENEMAAVYRVRP